MNISNFQILLHEAIDNATSTMDWLFLARAIEKLDMGQIRTVSAYANLPSAASNEGLLVFVDADERLYWSTGSAWYSIVQENKGISYAWGESDSGRLGNNNSSIDRSSPVSVVGGFTDWCQVSTGYRHSLGVRGNGTAWSWGYGGNGRLGNNSTIARSSPVSVVGGFTDWCRVAAGEDHSLGVRVNGTAWGWGYNTNGELGDATGTSRISPVSVVGGFTDWCQLSAGCRHSLGVRTNGTAWAWGQAQDGKLGNNTSTINRNSPVSVAGGFTDWRQLSAGRQHSLGLRSNGTAWAWGKNDGQLGDNSTIGRSSPVSVVGGFTDWCQVSAGSYHSLGVRTNGTAWSWGNNSQGRLGDNSATDRSSPVSVVGGFTDWCQLSGGYEHSAGVRSNGTAWSWGRADEGRLGNNNSVISRSSPVSVVGGFTDWCQVAAGGRQGLGLRATNFC
jgi:alpha-tubulin suppressor-like RCC1 family protein